MSKHALDKDPYIIERINLNFQAIWFCHLDSPHKFGPQLSQVIELKRDTHLNVFKIYFLIIK